MFYPTTPLQKIDKKISGISSQVTFHLNSIKDSDIMEKFLAEIVDIFKINFQTNIVLPAEEELNTVSHLLEDLKGGMYLAAITEDDELLKNISKSLEEIEESLRNILESYNKRAQELIESCNSLCLMRVMNSKLKAGEKAIQNSIKTFRKTDEGKFTELKVGELSSEILQDYISYHKNFYKIEVVEPLLPELIEPRIKGLEANHVSLILRNCQEYSKNDFKKVISSIGKYFTVSLKAEKCPRMTEQMLPDIINSICESRFGSSCLIFEIPNSNSPFNEKQRMNLFKKPLSSNAINAMKSVEFSNDSVKIILKYEDDDDTYEERLAILTELD